MRQKLSLAPDMKQLCHYFHPIEKLKRSRHVFFRNNEYPNFLQSIIKSQNLETTKKASHLNYIVVDFETTGLDPEDDLILSIGWVELSNNQIDLSSARHFYIINDKLRIKPETVVINHITPQMLLDGLSVEEAMTSFLEASKGKFIIAHGCVIEQCFLEYYLYSRYQIKTFPLLWLDTLCIEKNMARVIHHYQEIDLTLSSTRERYGLPEYNGHNAVSDAIATAELFLVQQKRVSSGNPLSIGDLYRISK